MKKDAAAAKTKINKSFLLLECMYFQKYSTQKMDRTRKGTSVINEKERTKYIGFSVKNRVAIHAINLSMCRESRSL